MSRLTSRSVQHPGFLTPGFTLVELLVVVSVLGIASVIGLTALRQSQASASLRQAAVELTGYLQSARQRTSTATSSCVLSISSSLVVAPTSVSPNSCSDTPSLDLRSVSALSALSVSGDTAITFLARGLSSAETTTILSDQALTQQACVLVSTPAGIVKRGRRPTPSSSCDYVSGY